MVQDIRSTQSAGRADLGLVDMQMDAEIPEHDQLFTPSASATYPNAMFPPSIQEAVNAQSIAWRNASNIFPSIHRISGQYAPSWNSHQNERRYSENFHVLERDPYGLSNPLANRLSAGNQDTNHTHPEPSSSLTDTWHESATQIYAMRESDDPSFWQTACIEEKSSEGTGSYENSSQIDEALQYSTVYAFPNTENVSGQMRRNYVSSAHDRVSVDETHTADVLANISCYICSTIFHGEYARGNLRRHEKTCHSKTLLKCESPGCERQYRRSDARAQHYRRSHPELA
ncbi:unnamed protein product [Periconia digitata]|uniref:C2H2-type domain-containing protein n=1 Tax=Periconia digitata TaxID=1303443 RepID=A0A9W4UBZ4_9PLEO|nr:unnamed protein product [Periconia digitata]